MIRVKNIHEQADIDEASLKTNIGNISHPDLILMRDLKVFKQVAPWTYPLKRFCCLTRTLDGEPRDYYLSSTERRVGCQRCIPGRTSSCVIPYTRISDTLRQVSLFQRAGPLRTGPLSVDNRNCSG